MISATPEKEARFQALKLHYGSILAWHGSPLANWHSIMRSVHGLVVCSILIGYANPNILTSHISVLSAGFKKYVWH